MKKLFLLIASAGIYLSGTAQVGPVNIGILPKNKSVKIVYDVTVANPVSPANTTQLSHQGTISGSNISPSVLTDDPDVAGYPHTPALATITLIDLPPYVVSINRQTPSVQLTNAVSVVYRVTFSQSVSNVDASDFTLNKTNTVNGSVASVSSSSGTEIDVTVNSITGEGDLRLDLNASGTGIVDAASQAITGGFTSGQVYTFDHSSPTVSINQTAGQADPTNASPINFTVLFSESVSGFDASDISFTGSTSPGTLVANVTGSGMNYSVSVSGMTGSGTVVVTIAASAANDAAGNGNSVSTSTDNSVTYDVTSPTVTINQASTQSDPASSKPVYFTIVFSEPVTGFDVTDVTIGGTAGGALISTGTEISPNNGTTYLLAVTGMTTDGTVIASIDANKAADAAGNLNTASTSDDNTITWIACQIVCPSNVSVNATRGQCSAVVTYDAATTTGDCGTLIYSKASGSSFDVGTTIVTVSSPSTGQSCQFSVTVNDAEAPSINCPANKTVNTEPYACTASVPFVATATDNCSTVGIKYYLDYGTATQQEITSPYRFDKGTTTVTAKATDAAENSGTCSFTVTVADHQNPTLKPPPDIVEYTGADATICGKYIPNSVIGDAEYSDNCGDVTLTVFYPDGNIFRVGTTSLAYLAIDAAGNRTTASQNITVIDDTPPVLTGCPGDTTVYTGPGASTCTKAVSWTPPIPSDNCSTGKLSSNHSPGDLFAKGQTTVTYTVTDTHGNQTSCSFNVTVIDNTPPVVTGCPSDLTVYTGTGNIGCTQTATWTEPTGSDNCDGTLTYVSRSHAPGSTFTKGSTTVTYTFKDAAGNETACSFHVTVVDNTLPVIYNCPSNISVNAGTNCQASASWTEPTATDNCGGIVTLMSRSHAPGSIFNLGTTNVKYIFQDAAGNKDSCVFTVTVVDNQAPTVSVVTATPNVMWPPDHRMKDILLSYSTNDNCGCTPVITVAENEADHGTGDNDKFPDYQIIDATHIKLRAERGNGKDARVYTITVTCTDASGHSNSSSCEVRVAHNITTPVTGSPFRIGSSVAFSGVFWDKPGSRHTAQWLINNSTTVKGAVTEPSGTKNGTATGSYKFTTTGVYKLQMNITDQNRVTSFANSNEDQEEIIVIYDPNGGYTYGGGYYDSPVGALTADATAAGKATYGFTVNYYKTATLPKGSTHFNFNVGSLQYDALNFDYLSVAGYKAVFAGSGKISGGISGVNFMMYVIDGALDRSGVDKVRLKIYNKNTGYIYYDNERGKSDAADPTTPVGLNSSVIIGGVSNPAILYQNPKEINTNAVVPNLELSAYPNPSYGDFNLVISSTDKNDKVVLRVTDVLGRVVEQRSVSPNQTISIGGLYRPGLYMVQAIQGNLRKEMKLEKIPD